MSTKILFLKRVTLPSSREYDLVSTGRHYSATTVGNLETELEPPFLSTPGLS